MDSNLDLLGSTILLSKLKYNSKIRRGYRVHSSSLETEEMSLVHQACLMHALSHPSACLCPICAQYITITNDINHIFHKIFYQFHLDTLAVASSTRNIHVSVAEWLACRTQARKSTGSNRSRDAVE